jgi:hypothetical protein
MIGRMTCVAWLVCIERAVESSSHAILNGRHRVCPRQPLTCWLQVRESAPLSGNVGERSWFCFVLVSFLSRLHCLSPMELSKNYEQCHYTLDPLLPYSTARLQGRRSRRSARLAVGIGGSGIPLPSSPLLATAHRPVLQSPQTVLPPNQPPPTPSPAHKGHAFFHQRAPPIARNPGRPILQRYFGLGMAEWIYPSWWCRPGDSDGGSRGSLMCGGEVLAR